MRKLKILEKLGDMRQNKLSSAIKLLILLFAIVSLTVVGRMSESADDSTANVSPELFPQVVVPEYPEGEETDGGEALVPIPPKLKTRAVRFNQAYFRVIPGEKIASRRDRVREYVAPAYLPKLNLAVPGDGSLEGRGKLIVAQMTAQPGPNKWARIITVPVVVTYTNRSGLDVSVQNTVSSTMWSSKRTKRNPTGRWLLQSTEVP